MTRVQQPLRTRDFRLIVAAVALSSLGDELALIALTIKVFELRHSGFAVSALLLAGLAPLALLAPAAGLLVDRSEKVRLLAAASLAQAALATGLASTSSFPAILVLSFLLGAGAAVAQPALYAVIPSVVGEEATTRANAWLEAGKYAGWVAGPLVAGVLAQTVGTGAALYADALSFLAIAGAAAALGVRCPSTTPAERRRGEARRGFAFVARDRVLRVAVAVLVATVLFAAIDNVAEVFFANDVLGAGSWGYGALAAAWLAGMVVGASAVARRIGPARLAHAVMAGSFVVGAAVASAALSGRTVAAIALFFVGGLGNGIENVSIRSLIHRRAPEELRGRVFAAYFGLVAVTQLAATALGGLLVGLLGSRSALLVSGAGGAAIALAGLVWIARSVEVVRIPEAEEPAKGGPEPAAASITETDS